MPKRGKKVRRSLGRISLVDRFLMLYMLILLGYLVFHLFSGIGDTQTIPKQCPLDWLKCPEKQKGQVSPSQIHLNRCGPHRLAYLNS